MAMASVVARHRPSFRGMSAFTVAVRRRSNCEGAMPNSLLEYVAEGGVPVTASILVGARTCEVPCQSGDLLCAQPSILPSLGVFRNPSAGCKTTIDTQVGGSQSGMYRETSSPIPLHQLCGKASVSGDQGGFGRNCETCLTQTIEDKKTSFPQVVLDAGDRSEHALHKVIHPFPGLDHGVF